MQNNDNITPDAIEKKKRKRSARVYANLAQLTPEQLRERLDILREFFPPDDYDNEETVPEPKKKKPADNGAFALAQGYQHNLSPDRVAMPDETKVHGAERQFGREAAIPVGQLDGDWREQNGLATVAGDCGSTAVAPGQHVTTSTGSHPRYKQQLGEAPLNPLARAAEFMSTQDKSAADMSRSADQAPVHHELNFQQQPRNLTAFQAALSRLRTNPYAPTGSASWNSPTSQSDNPVQAPGGNVRLDSFDAAAAAGSMTGVHGRDVLNEVRHVPEVRTEYHQQRSSAPNGTHSRYDPCCAPPASVKSRLDIMRECMYGE